MITTERLLFLIAVNGYMAYRHTLGRPAPADIQRAFKQADNPQPGDLVLETSTAWSWLKSGQSPGPALGILLRVSQELVVYEEAEDDPDSELDQEGDVKKRSSHKPSLYENVFYIAPLDESRSEYRWTNANFIALHTEKALPYRPTAD